MKYLALSLLTLAAPASAQTFTWPISGTSTPDVMNTSFGPRIEDNAWDFHDGMDLPGSCDLTTQAQTANDTVVRAVTDGQVVAAGNANGIHSSRHVVIETTDDAGNTLRIVYYHLKKIDAAYFGAGVTLPKPVTRGTAVGLLGKDGAQTCHLHLEFRRNGPNQVSSVHPLHYLPYTDTANWTAPTAATARFNGANGDLDARLFFTAIDKLEGDLAAVEVDVRDATGFALETRRITLDDKTTISEGSDDTFMFNAQGMALEGYQAPDMITDGRTDLHYGVILRDLPAGAASLVARIYDLSGLRVTSAAIAVPTQAAFSFAPDLDSVPAGATQIVQSSGVVSIGSGKVTASDTITSGSTQVAAYEIALPTNRFQWRATATVKPTGMSYPNSGNYSHLLYFGNGANLLASARIRSIAAISTPAAGLGALDALGVGRGKDGTVALVSGASQVWTVELLRLGTREATAILRRDGVENLRLNWNAGATADRFRLGLANSSPAATAVIEQSAVSVVDTF